MKQRFHPRTVCNPSPFCDSDPWTSICSTLRSSYACEKKKKKKKKKTIFPLLRPLVPPMANLHLVVAPFVVLLLVSLSSASAFKEQGQSLRFSEKGEFRILQVADMHYGDGETTPCEDVLPQQVAGCSDLNTTAFLRRMIAAVNPHLIVFTGDNIFGFDATDAASSMNAAFSPAISSNIPWAAVLGNHDQESMLSRAGVMKHIVGMKHSLSQFNPAEVEDIDGFGNYNLEVHGVEGSAFENKSVLNLYFLDSGDYSTVPFIPGYGWIKPSQQFWFENTSKKLQNYSQGCESRTVPAGTYRICVKPVTSTSNTVPALIPANTGLYRRFRPISDEMERAYMNKPEAQKAPAPGLAYFHIPLPEFASFDSSNFTGVKQEGISSASVNSGFFTTLVEAGDVKAVFIGHDHVNDFCGELTGIHLCYAGGFGYHAYGKAGWDRRARVVVASLEKTENGGWGAVKSIKTRKYLDNQQLTTIDVQVLWSTGIAFLPPNLFSLCLCFFQFILLQENTQGSML
ncbi:hypothetical protein RHMOL_Rhmol01G0243200 [Rhododendron molle]|uniref:Uncharacterized protein n=1 Tax=Rhododendron molle TaxID=49168 RepID=A0ACC0Q6T2_RHOML|nr:hypothetical protein RHMOL_Rhmol01G0243200 [Rhododendron molle]